LDRAPDLAGNGHGCFGNALNDGAHGGLKHFVDWEDKSRAR